MICPTSTKNQTKKQKSLPKLKKLIHSNKIIVRSYVLYSYLQSPIVNSETKSIYNKCLGPWSILNNVSLNSIGHSHNKIVLTATAFRHITKILFAKKCFVSLQPVRLQQAEQTCLASCGSAGSNHVTCHDMPHSSL